MNDRNEFVHGQTAPITDDAPAPEQGWRGERAADETAEGQRQRHHIRGVSAEVEEISGTAHVETAGLHGSAQDAFQDDGGGGGGGETWQGKRGAQAPDGVNDLDLSGSSPGGESAGAPYPHGHRKPSNDPGSLMGHGGQTEINYHGTGHLGSTKIGDDDDRNGVTETED